MGLTYDAGQGSFDVLDNTNGNMSEMFREKLDISNKNLGVSDMESCLTDETVSIPIQCNFSSLHEEVFDQIL